MRTRDDRDECSLEEVTAAMESERLAAETRAAKTAAAAAKISPACPQAIRAAYLSGMHGGMGCVFTPAEWVGDNFVRLGWSAENARRAAVWLGASPESAARIGVAPRETRDDGGWRVED